MTTEVLFPWETEYLTENNESMWGPPSDIYSHIIPFLPPAANILDAGCGDGRHSLLLAEHGFNVTAVDISPGAIQMVNRLAAKRQVAIQTVLNDIVMFDVARDYDLVIAHGLLHLLPSVDSKVLLDRFQQCTRRGGYNVIVVTTNKIPLPSYAQHYMVGLFEDGELARNYADWDVVTCESYSKPASPLIPHPRHFNKLAARKQ